MQRVPHFLHLHHHLHQLVPLVLQPNLLAPLEVQLVQVGGFAQMTLRECASNQNLAPQPQHSTPPTTTYSLHEERKQSNFPNKNYLPGHNFLSQNENKYLYFLRTLPFTSVIRYISYLLYFSQVIVKHKLANNSEQSIE